ncbi:ABC transporter permease [Nocardia panacis]|uniref:ABC transporter permease n=1 Tax=Nocardia panacis TaxID=2340916 RepID=A0A3A4K7K5_9NOCA|nr:ABC transporter permease [Nocardia panacis]RJO73502.1 ABC transporter permease [Nocardia panacis]
MTTAVAGRHTAPALGSTRDFAGTWQLLRLYLRRDRVIFPLWVLAFAFLPAFYVASTKKAYSTPIDLDKYAKTIEDTPALVAMYGNLYSHDLGPLALWKAGPYFAFIGVATILTVIRHTRVEEETGRAELVGATSIGRYAGLTAVLIMTTVGCGLVALFGTMGLKGSGLPGSGSLAFAGTLGLSGLLWSGVGAVAAQVSAGARTARGIALGALAAAFALRAIGDAGNGVLSWFSPLGWCLQVRAFGGERWWVMLLLVATAVIGVTAAYWLLQDRDTGSGLVAERPGPPRADAALSGPAGLAWRLQRGSLLGWAIGFLLYGLLMGGVVNSVGDMLSEGAVHDVVTRMGGTDALKDAFITLAMGMLAIGSAAYSLSATMRLHEEESSERAEATLAGAVSRPRYAASHLGFALLGPALLLVIAAVAIGVMYGFADGDMAGKLAKTLGAALVQLPAVWVLTGVATAIYGLAPKYTQVAWGVLSLVLVIYFLGALNGLPQWVVDLVPFTHVPKVPGSALQVAPLLWLLAVAAALLGMGIVAFRRRDLR